MLISVTRVAHDGPVKVLENSKDGLPDPRGSLANEVRTILRYSASQSRGSMTRV